MSKHIPGPWTVLTGENETGCSVGVAFGEPIGNVSIALILEKPAENSSGTGIKLAHCVSAGFWNEESVRATARLVATAPELLEACKLALKALANKDELDIEQTLVDVIAKAEGRKDE